MSMTGWTEGRWVVGSLVITAIFWLIHRLESQIRARGTLFPASRPPGARRLALLLGPFVIGFCTVCWLSGVQLYGFILLGIALVGYGLDFGGLLSLFQGGDDLAIERAVHQEDLPPRAGGRCQPNTHQSQVLDL
jgi:hypothetical protein